MAYRLGMLLMMSRDRWRHNDDVMIFLNASSPAMFPLWIWHAYNDGPHA